MAFWWSTEPDTNGASRAFPRAALAALGLVFLAGCSSKPPLPALGMIPDFKLTDQNGAAFDSSRQLAKKIWIADFIYTNCPGPCPRMSSQMHQVQDELLKEPGAGDRIRFVSFTVDPARDTPPVLKAYGQHFEAATGKWFFLTGAQLDLQKLGRDAFKLNNVDGNLDHSTRFALVDGESRLRGYYPTLEPEAIPNVIADAKRLLKEGS